MDDSIFLFEVDTPLGFKVRCSKEYWFETIIKKHPVMTDKITDVMMALSDPNEIRRSRKDDMVYLFYKGDSPRWTCAVIKNKTEYGFLVTAYPTDSIKEGDNIWKK